MEAAMNRVLPKNGYSSDIGRVVSVVGHGRFQVSEVSKSYSLLNPNPYRAPLQRTAASTPSMHLTMRRRFDYRWLCAERLLNLTIS